MRQSLLALAAIGVSCALAGTAQAQVIQNGGFETAGAPGVSSAMDWMETPAANGAPGTVVQRVTSPVHSGQFAEEISAVNPTTGAGGEDSNIIQETSGQYNGNPVGGDAVSAANGPYTLSFYLMGTAGVSGVMFAQAQWANSSGLPIGGGGSSTYVSLPGSYTQESINLGSPPSGAAGVYLEFSSETGAVDGGSEIAYVDDVAVTGTSVPEPAGLAMLGIAALGVIRHRRH